MTGRGSCTFFIPQNGGYARLLVCNVHWQEELVGTKGVDSGGALCTRRAVRVYAPISAPLPANLALLCGACYVVAGGEDFLGGCHGAAGQSAAQDTCEDFLGGCHGHTGVSAAAQDTCEDFLGSYHEHTGVSAAAQDTCEDFLGSCYGGAGMSAAAVGTTVGGAAPAPQDTVFTLMAAAKCDYGSPALHHWELLLHE